MKRRLTVCLAWAFLGCAVLGTVRAEDYNPPIAAASDEGQLAIGGFQVPKGVAVKLFAAEPMLANPVVFGIDQTTGQVYVCETFRQQKGVEDNRSHMNWLLDDLSLQTVDDRVAMFRKHLGDKANDYTKEQDRIRRITDTNGDGVADQSTVYAQGFNAIEDGTGAGVLIHNGDVFYTCIPKLWKLRDSSGDGIADSQTALANGFGVRVAFRGHDMHGLQLGPDGRVYFSIGDRGYNVTTAEGQRLVRPDTGAVFRCELDGSHLEVYAFGLRNPQELAFDDYGNLFTGDNNSDSGDKARWVYVVEGGDTGWRMYYQYLPDRGPWNREHIWHPYRESDETTAVQPASIIPPLLNLGDGPSGLVHYPGTGLPERYRRHFFLADFRGSAANSGVRSFAVEPVGASFQVVDSHWYLQRVLATDVDFTPDGRMMVSDWVDGWNGPGKGRLYTFTDQAATGEATQDVAKRLAAGLGSTPPTEIASLLGHADQRVRQMAQFELTKRNDLATLTTVLASDAPQLAKIHAVWAAWQLGRDQGKVTPLLLTALADPDAEVRAQAAKVAGELRLSATEATLIQQVQTGTAREQFFAAIALGHLQSTAAVPALAERLAVNQDQDPMLRHAVSLGLSGAADRAAVKSLATHTNRSVRLGVVLAMRRWQDPALAQFLNDGDLDIAVEAARAIHDLPIAEALPALAVLADQPLSVDALARRAMNANFRLGDRGGAERVARMAASTRTPEHLRLEAIAELMDWAQPPVLDRVTNEHRPLAARDATSVRSAVQSALGSLLAGSDKVRTEAVKLAAKYGITEVGPELAKLFQDAAQPSKVRVESLKALGALKVSTIRDVVDTAITDADSAVRSEALRQLAPMNPTRAVQAIATVLNQGAPAEQQAAVRILGGMPSAEADPLLTQLLTRMLDETLIPEVHLDLIEVIEGRDSLKAAPMLQQYQATQAANVDPLFQHRASLLGGDAERGKEVFFGNAAASCRRCHMVSGQGGAVGPDLSSVGLVEGKPRSRLELLESILLPNAKIAKGFETVVLVTDDGLVYTGVLREETAETVKLMTATGEIVTVPTKKIEERARGKSGMPEDVAKGLTKRDLRDLVEYLSRQVTPADPSKH
ncbi:MAG: glucose dehydrogenase [Planctomycetota bacterium]|nr:MAG: glucose dehydrogenase [Planctomycetota bacterium]